MKCIFTKKLFNNIIIFNKIKTNTLCLPVSFKNFYFQQHIHGAGDPEIVAKRVIKCVGQRLREIDPQRWDGVPITFQTKFNTHHDVRTSVLVHDALEREFLIDVDDKKILLSNIKDCVNFILEFHNAI